MARDRTQGKGDGPPTLSVCLIARNEADRLRSALDSVRDVAWEVVVVDTGSTDGTIDVALSWGARGCGRPCDQRGRLVAKEERWNQSHATIPTQSSGMGSS